MSQNLQKLAEEDFCYLTTIGRISGRSHTIEIWFALHEQTLYMLSGGRDKSDWVKNALQNPAVQHGQKLKLLDAIIARLDGSKMLRNFIAVLIDHHRIGQMDDIAEQFKHELNQRLGIAETQVKSARELTPEERQSLEKQMEAVTGKVVRATYSRDATLLGGIVVRIGSTIYDGSVRGQLERIKEQIAAS